MCGIAGIVHLQGVYPHHLYVMSRVLKHRGPDDEGFVLLHRTSNSLALKGHDTIKELEALPWVTEQKIDPSYPVGFVHRRLSILDLSAAGHQPMTSHDQAYSIVFNGEIYNYKELRSELVQKGHSFTSESDTEVLLVAYKAWGEKCVEKLAGMWAFALYDKANNRVFMSRDRFGIKPLYYFKNETAFAFASEIKALLALEFIAPEANMEAVFEYICFGATADPSANLFKHIHVFPPAHYAMVDLTSLQITIQRYYHLGERITHYALPDSSNIQDTYSHVLNHAVDIHLRSDVPIGSTLSGGLDSSTIVALAASKLNGKPFKTYTAAYHEKDIDESDFAKKVVAGYSNIKSHYTYPNIKTYWQDIDALIWHQDLPINSTSMFAQWEVMKLAHQQNTKVLLDGQGADEILGGYYNFAGIFLLEKLKHLQLHSFFNEKKELQRKFSPNINHPLGRALYYYVPEWLQHSLRAKKRLGMSFINNSYQSKLHNISIPARGGKSFREQSLLSIEFGLQDLLRYEDRNSMAFSIESRVPFLDHRLVELSIALPNDWKIKNGWTKYILRKTAEPLLNKEVVWRKYKMGFLTPQQLWKLNSQQELNQLIHETPIPDFIDKPYLIQACKATITDSSHLSEFWKIVSFLKWAHIFKVTFNR